MSITTIKIVDKQAVLTEAPPPRPEPPPKPPPDPNWPYNPEASVIAWTLARALQHFIAIRAKGSTPDEGGPSFMLADRTTEAFTAAAELAREFWPAANTFELVGADRYFPTAQLEADGLPANASVLRRGLPFAAFNLKKAAILPLPADYEAAAKIRFSPPPPAIQPWER